MSIEADDVGDLADRRNRRSAAESLPRELQELGLSPYEARVLVALLQMGTANTLQLAKASGVPRTSTYQVLEALGARRLATRLPGEGPAVWASAGREEILERLQAALEAEQEQRLKDHRARASHVSKLLDEAVPDHPAPALPFVHIIHGRGQVTQAFERMLADSRSEFVVFNRPPYSWEPGSVNPAIVNNVRRGVHTRALYQAIQLSDPGWAGLRHDIEAYHAAGVQGRVVERLPMKMAIADRRVALLALPEPSGAQEGFPTNLLVEHPGFAALLAELFDMLWLNASPYRHGLVDTVSEDHDSGTIHPG